MKVLPCPCVLPDANFTTMRKDDFLRNRQPQPGAVFFSALAGRVSPVEALENARQRFGRDAKFLGAQAYGKSVHGHCSAGGVNFQVAKPLGRGGILRFSLHAP